VTDSTARCRPKRPGGAREIRKSRTRLPVLRAQACNPGRQKVRDGVLKSGAAGYMTKESAPEALVGADQKVLARPHTSARASPSRCRLPWHGCATQAPAPSGVRPGIHGSSPVASARNGQPDPEPADAQREDHQHLPGSASWRRCCHEVQCRVTPLPPSRTAWWSRA